MSGHVFDLLAQQRAALEQSLRDLLANNGVDPDDRTDGWEDRARAILSRFEAVDTFEMSDDFRASITTTIRPRQPERRPWSATICEVCDGSGAIDERYDPAVHGWIATEPTVCWYCKGSGWYEAAT